MPTRQDQVHSYQFMVQRVVAAIVMRETDPAQSPFRRVAGATLAGVMVTLLALAAVAVYGVISPDGRHDWRDGTAVIVERESGARYVLRDGVLHPVVNYVSALLVLGGAAPRTVLVSRGSIAEVRRGVPLGIAGAPDSLPAADSLLGPPWTLCSRAVPGAGAASVLFVGSTVDGGRPMGEDGLLARHDDGGVWLVWRQRRHLVREPAVLLPALGWGGERPVPVAPALLDALTAGADLGRIAIPDRGRRSPAVPGARQGEVFVIESQGGSRQYAVVLRDGLASVTQVQADLLIGDPLTVTLVGQTGARPLDQGRYAVLPKVGALLPGGELAAPARTPALVRPADPAGICGTVRDAGAVADLRVGAPVGEVALTARAGQRPGVRVVSVDRVVVAPGRGVLVEAVVSAQARGGPLSLVTDLGVRHEVVSSDVPAMLGYAGVGPVRLPASVVNLLPAGPALDPVRARAPAIG